MDSNTELIVTLQNAIQEMIAALKAVRIVLYNQGITTPEELGKLQLQARQALAQTPKGKDFEYLLSQVSDTH
ncbi:MAG: hypothetical protein ACRD2B_16330 [Terriglobia bacterium]